MPFLCLSPVPLNVFVHTTAYQPSTLLFDLIFFGAHENDMPALRMKHAKVNKQTAQAHTLTNTPTSPSSLTDSSRVRRLRVLDWRIGPGAGPGVSELGGVNPDPEQ